MRAEFFAEVLEQELSQAAVKHRFQPAHGNQRATSNPFKVIYESQECLNAILHKLSDEQQKSIKGRLAKIQKNLPAEVKNYLHPNGTFGGAKNVEHNLKNVEHNLKALIAKCEGLDEPVFVSIPEANGSGFGGGVF